RWMEEVTIIQEEMHRTVAYCRWSAVWWKEQANMWFGLSLGLQEGLCAYTVHQALRQEGQAVHLENQWSMVGPH
ncbi:hypothetical protein BS47DRAFT_1271378, partial [Hydnum rufescens UP504]